MGMEKVEKVVKVEKVERDMIDNNVTDTREEKDPLNIIARVLKKHQNISPQKHTPLLVTPCSTRLLAKIRIVDYTTAFQ